MKSGMWFLIKDMWTVDTHRKRAIKVLWASLMIDYIILVLDLAMLRKFLTEFSLYEVSVSFPGCFTDAEF